MKYFYTAIIITTILIIGLYSYKQNLFSFTQLPYDAEQENLDEQIIIHFSHVVAENTPKGMAAARFAQLVTEKTEGQIVVQVYPNGILYKDNTEVEALRNNDIQMIAPTFSKLTQFDNAWEVLDLPFVIESHEQLYNILNGTLQNELMQTLEAQNMKGLKFWSNGFKQIATNDTTISTLDDFHKLRIRIMKSPLLEAQFTALGAQPVQTTFDDVFDQLENNVINSQDNTLSNLYSKGFHTFEKNITISNHGILGYALIVNNDFWETLETEHQQAIHEALEEMQRWQFEQSIALNVEAYEQLEALEDTSLHTLPETTKKAWQQQLNSLYANYHDNIYYQSLIKDLNKTE